MTLMRKKRTTFNENCTKRRNKKRSAGGRLHSYIVLRDMKKSRRERFSRRQKSSDCLFLLYDDEKKISRSSLRPINRPLTSSIIYLR